MEPYAYGWERTHTANQLQDIYKHLADGEESKSEKDAVSVAGRIVARRAFGKLAFLTLRDDSGTIQVWLLAQLDLLYLLLDLSSLVVYTFNCHYVYFLSCLLILDGYISFLVSLEKRKFVYPSNKTKQKL